MVIGFSQNFPQSVFIPFISTSDHNRCTNPLTSQHKKLHGTGAELILVNVRFLEIEKDSKVSKHS